MHQSPSDGYQYRWIFCDVGNTLIHWPPARSRAIEAAWGLGHGAILSAAFGSALGHRAMTGQISHEAWLSGLKEWFPAEAIDEWIAFDGILNQDLVRLLEAAKSAGVRIALVSNASRALAKTLERHSVDTLADDVICSAEVGAAKPDPAIFEIALHRTGASAARVVYIDDVPGWAAVARSCGMTSIVYTNAADLEVSLTALGVFESVALTGPTRGRPGVEE